jgi:hypothetical protein
VGLPLAAVLGWSVCSAAMPPVLIWRASTGTVEELVSAGLPLGGGLSPGYQERNTALATGDTLLFATDGLAETLDPEGNQLGYEARRTPCAVPPDAGSNGSGNAHLVALASDTAYLWFFAPTNVEAVLKVLNGCGLNSHYWVFAGGLTNVKVVITVTDTANGTQKVFSNPANTTFLPIQNTSAFATCP